MSFQFADLPRLLPELMLILLGVLVIASDVLERWGTDAKAVAERQHASAQLAAVSLGLVFVVTLVQSRYLFTVPQPQSDSITDRLLFFVYNLQQAGPGGQPLLGAFTTDHLTQVSRLIFLGAGFLVVLLTMGQRSRGNPGEFYGLLLFSTAGMCLMSGASELILAFIALELASIPQYVLAGFFRDDRRAAEAGMKYFLYGVFSSAILLYGMSLAYGLVASAQLTSASGGGVIATLFGSIAEAGTASSPLLLVSVTLIIAGLGYKIAAVPFHSYAPDVYEGAPAAITAFISTASKTAGFVLLFRLLTVAFPGAVGSVAWESGWAALILLMALATVIGGNLAALPQQNAKRMLAYSSIGHAGFLLLAFLLWSSPSLGAQAFTTQALLYYLIAYSITNIGAFGALAVVAELTGGDNIRDLAGLGRRNAGLATMLTVFVLSLAGVPPLAGYWAKFFVFMAGYRAGAVWLVAVAVVMTVVSLAYYLKLLKAMWFDSPTDETPIMTPAPMNAALVIALVLVIVLGIFPNAIWPLLAQAAIAGR